jgi:site-specific DNA-methyltransferase (adenine-specific)
MKKYDIIYANPPWMYKHQHFSFREKTFAETNKNCYPAPMATADIIALPVESICEDNCVLFLWVTTPILPEALHVVNAWGFTYKTMFTWEKTNEGCMGYWFKTCTEHLIIATKGNVKAFGSNIRNCYHEPKRKHGKKPEYFYRIIEKVAKGRRIELFARSYRSGWDVWEIGVEKSIPSLNESPLNA